MTPPKSTRKRIRSRRTRARTSGSKVFFIALGVSLVCGFILRTWIAQLPLKDIIHQNIAQALPQAQVQIGSAKMTLADGWWPEIAVQMDQVQLELPGACAVENSRIKIGQVVVPLSIKSLWRPGIHWGTVRARGVSVEIGKECGSVAGSQSPISSSKPGTPNTSTSSISTSAVVPLPSFLTLRATLNHLQQRIRVSGFSLHNLQLHWWEGEKTLALDVPYLSLTDLDGIQTVHLRGSVEVPPWIGLVRDLPRLGFTGEISSRDLQLELQGYWQEGFIRTHLGWTHEDQIVMSGSLQHLPLVEMGDIQNKYAQLKAVDVRPRLAWISCEAKFNSTLKMLPESELDLEPCKIEGSLGQVLFPQVLISFFPRVEIAPFTARLSDVSLDGLLQLFSIAGPRGVFARLGHLDGRLLVHSKKTIEFDGVVFGPEIWFSNLGQRLKQKIDQVKIEAKLDAGRIRGKLSDAILENGLVQGQTTFDLQEGLDDGQFQIQLNALKFDPAITQLMFGGDLENVQLTGIGRILKQKLVAWNGELTSKTAQRPGLSIKNLRVKSRLGEHGLKLHVQADQLEIQANASQLRWFAPLAQAAHWQGPVLNMKKFVTDIEASPDRFYWDHLSLLGPDGRSGLTSRGGWDSDDRLVGWVRMKGRHQSASWRLVGTRMSPQLQLTQADLSVLEKWPSSVESSTRGVKASTADGQVSGARKFFNEIRQFLRSGSE